MEPLRPEQKIEAPRTPPLPPSQGSDSDEDVKENAMETVPEEGEFEGDEEVIDLQTQVDRLSEINDNNITYIAWLHKRIADLDLKNEKLNVLVKTLQEELNKGKTNGGT